VSGPRCPGRPTPRAKYRGKSGATDRSRRPQRRRKPSRLRQQTTVGQGKSLLNQLCKCWNRDRNRGRTFESANSSNAQAGPDRTIAISTMLHSSVLAASALVVKLSSASCWLFRSLRVCLLLLDASVPSQCPQWHRTTRTHTARTSSSGHPTRCASPPVQPFLPTYALPSAPGRVPVDWRDVCAAGKKKRLSFVCLAVPCWGARTERRGEGGGRTGGVKINLCHLALSWPS
jgi:hypothetical protein